MRERLFRGRVRIGRRVATAVALAALAAAVTGFGVLARSGSAEVAAGPGRDPLVVKTDAVRLETGYDVVRRFVGRVEARQASDVGFEIGGRVTDVLIDEGERIEPGQVIARLDAQRLSAQRVELAAQRDQAVARLELADLTLERLRDAFAAKAANQREFDEVDKARDEAAAALALAEAAIASIDVDIAKAVIRSPFRAAVSRRHVDPGRVVEAGTPIVSLLEVEAPRARIGVAAAAADQFDEGDGVVVDVAGRSIAGVVHAILPTRDALGRDVDVIVELDAELNGLRQGDLARLAVERRVQTPGFWVPTSALTEGTRGLWSLYTLAPTDGTSGATPEVLQAEVEMVHAAGDRAFVRGALPEGTRFVADGLHRIAPGMTVRDEGRLVGGGAEPARVGNSAGRRP